jgi:hypothetical protein
MEILDFGSGLKCQEPGAGKEYHRNNCSTSGVQRSIFNMGVSIKLKYMDVPPSGATPPEGSGI